MARTRTSTILLVLGLLMLLGFVLLLVGIGVALIRPPPTEVADGSVLVLDLGGRLQEGPNAEDPLSEAFGRTPSSLAEMRQALTLAAADQRIEQVLVRVHPLGVGLGKVQELREEIERFRERSSGKPINAYVSSATTKEYYLASACDKVWMPPMGLLLVNGINLQVTFWKGTLDKLGLRAQFVRIGRYKSAVEPLTQEKMSEAYREVLNSLADEIMDQMIGGIAQSRGLSSETVQSWIDDPSMDAQSALERGMVDALFYPDQLREQLNIGADDDRLISARSYHKQRPSSLGIKPKATIAVLYAEGAIAGGKSDDKTVGSATLAQAIRDAADDEEVEALLLRVNSPGGSGEASDLIWRELLLASEDLPIVVSMSDYAASGGYYISMGADRIFAQPGTLTGSIGVFAGKFDTEELYKNIGAHVERIQRGPYSAIFSGSRPFDEQEQKKLAAYIENFYDQFVTKAAEGRKQSWDEIDAVAQGRVWTGRQAVAEGLVDELGGIPSALAYLRKELGLEPNTPVALRTFPRPTSLLEQIMDRSSGGPGVRMGLGPLLPALEDDLSQAQALARALDGTPTALMPMTLSF